MQANIIVAGGRPVPEMEERPQPRLSLKVGYFLTDTTIPFSGAMRIVPRSHKMGDPPPAGTVDPPGAMDVCVKPGTAVLCESSYFVWMPGGLYATVREASVMSCAYAEPLLVVWSPQLTAVCGTAGATITLRPHAR